MASGFATVKEVVSGDTLVLVGQPSNGPPPEIRLSLASLAAPRLGAPKSGGGAAKDEPFAWPSREFLRQACIGQHVSFKVEYSVPAINRQFGEVCLTTGEKLNLGILVARNGWAKVKKEGSDKEQSGSYEELVRLSATAEEQGLGIFNKDEAKAAATVRDVTYDIKQPADLLEQVKGSPQRAVVEYVRDGGSFKMLLLDLMTMVSFNLAGVQCPRVNSGDSAGDAEPFAREAKYFTEIRLLNRDVKLVINGIDDRFNTFYGSVQHPAGDISVELVKNGLARAVDWSMQYTSLQHAATLRGATKDAKNKKLRLWKDYKAPTISGDKTFEGVVSEIVSGDTIMVRVGTEEQLAGRPWECQERRVSLSSIRAPLMGSRARNQPDAPYAAESRELLREKALGKRCMVSIEYERAPPEGAVGLAARPRSFGTVGLFTKKSKKNVARLLLEAGLAELIRHRPDDERSAFYDELQGVQEKAKAAGRGMFAANPKTEPTERRVNDLTTNANQARTHISALQAPRVGGQRAGVHKAIVEYVIHASRMRVYLPAEGILMNFAIGGIETPQGARPANKGRAATEAQPYAEEATIYTRSLVLQREVEIHVESMDKGGTAIGQIKVMGQNGEINVALALLEAGLARVNEFSARFVSNSDAFYREEKLAKEKRINIWTDYVEPTEEELAEAAALASGESKMETVPVCVSEIVNGGVFYLQNLKPNNKAQLDATEAAMAAIGDATPGAAGTGVMEPRKNMNVLALFDDGEGNKWFRAKILAVRTEGAVQTAHVRYIDYGNEAFVKTDSLKVADDSVFATPAAAQEAELAFVTIPDLSKEFGREAAIALSDLVFGKEVEAVVHNKDNRLSVSLLTAPAPKEGETESDKQDVAEILLREGLGYVDSRATRYLKGANVEIAKKLNAAQEMAHAEHLNLWRYGDPRDDEK
mmetsp:Transcript_8588/g.15747  ORF Transcript_8588/g.15747 Transcript_8588/m.15747 type:complete len:931 (-) Transcript_8588:130-2922(-)